MSNHSHMRATSNSVHGHDSGAARTKSQSVERRLEFMQLDHQGRAGIRSLKTLIERELPHGLDKFYAQLRKSPEVSRII